MRFVLIDRLLVLEPGRRASASASFGRHRDVFEDHFPGFPVVPGVLLTEAMGQTAGWLLAATLGFSRWPLLTLVDRAKFRSLVRPDETVRTEAEIRAAHPADYEVAVRASVGERRVADARLLFHLFDFDVNPSERDAFTEWARATFSALGGPEALERR